MYDEGRTRRWRNSSSWLLETSLPGQPAGLGSGYNARGVTARSQTVLNSQKFGKAVSWLRRLQNILASAGLEQMRMTHTPLTTFLSPAVHLFGSYCRPKKQ
ncbi:unnamed protein product, partial [Ectocarpus sp. 12 AP-2014]